MNYKQALAVLSDFLMKCEEEGVALPTDPLDAVIAAIRALEHEAKHEIGRRQMESALVHMRQQCGVVKQDRDDAKPAPRRKKAEENEGECSSEGDKGEEQDGDEEEEEEEVVVPRRKQTLQSPPPGAKRKPGKLQDEIASKPAKCVKNQALVDQLAQLGDYEMKHGHPQRGIARLRAAKEVRDTSEVITSGAQARKLDRVGQSAASKIDAILHGGLKNAMGEYTSD